MGSMPQLWLVSNVEGTWKLVARKVSEWVSLCSWVIWDQLTQLSCRQFVTLSFKFSIVNFQCKHFSHIQVLAISHGCYVPLLSYNALMREMGMQGKQTREGQVWRYEQLVVLSSGVRNRADSDPCNLKFQVNCEVKNLHVQVAQPSCC